MTARSEAKRAFYKELRVAMRARGFAKVSGTQRFVRPLGPGIEGQLGFADATKQSDVGLWVDPSVGALVTEVEDLISEWTLTPASWTTLYCNVGYLPPRDAWFDVPLATVSDVPSALESLLGTVDAKTAEFFAGGARPGYLADLMEGGIPMIRSEERVPLLHAIGGNAERAKKAFSALESKVESSVSPSLRTLRYVEGFRSHFPDLVA